MTTASDTPSRLQRAGSSILSGYRLLVTEADAFINKAKAAQRRQAEAEARLSAAIADRNEAIVEMHKAGLSPGAISKELTHGGFTMSATNVRLIINVHRGPRATKDGSDA